jgi:hypothetical protein
MLLHQNVHALKVKNMNNDTILHDHAIMGKKKSEKCHVVA